MQFSDSGQSGESCSRTQDFTDASHCFPPNRATIFRRSKVQNPNCCGKEQHSGEAGAMAPIEGKFLDHYKNREHGKPPQIHYSAHKEKQHQRPATTKA